MYYHHLQNILQHLHYNIPNIFFEYILVLYFVEPSHFLKGNEKFNAEKNFKKIKDSKIILNCFKFIDALFQENKKV